MKTLPSSTPSNKKKILKKIKKADKIKTESKDNENLYEKARTLYEEKARKALQKYNISKSDQAWMKKILSTGTLKDKISALCIYIRDNPKTTLQCIENMLSYCLKSSKKDSLSSLLALKNLFIEVLLPPTFLKSFQESLKNTQNPSISLENAYFEHSLKELYFKYLKILEEKLKDPLEWVKKNVISCLTDLVLKSVEQEQFIVSMLVNKFGDNDKKLILMLNNSLARILHKHNHLTAVGIREIEGFIYRPNLSQKAQFYAISFLNTLQLAKLESTVLKNLIRAFFGLFKKIVQIENIEVNSSKLMSNIMKGINKIFPFLKKNASEFKSIYEPEIDNLYKILHKTQNFKIKIQILLFLFQTSSFSTLPPSSLPPPSSQPPSSSQTLSPSHLQPSSHQSPFSSRIPPSSIDRYYRVLYEMLLSEEIWQSSLTELFFDLLFYSIKIDKSVVRVKAFLKRLLQNAIHSDPPFLITTLIFTSRVFENVTGAKTLVTFPEPKEEESEDEHFQDYDDEEELNQQNEKKQLKSKKFKAKENGYDPLKREPLFSKADQTCLWELHLLLNHYHPTVRKFAEKLLNGGSVSYTGNPLLDFTLTNFLDRITFKKAKKTDSTIMKNLISKKKIRMAKIEDPLNMEEGEGKREEEEYFRRYFEERRRREGGKKRNAGERREEQGEREDEDEELEQFADNIMEEKMESLQKEGVSDEEEDEDFAKFLNEELEMEEDELEFEEEGEGEEEEGRKEEVGEEEEGEEEEEEDGGKKLIKERGMKKIQKNRREKKGGKWMNGKNRKKGNKGAERN